MNGMFSWRSCVPLATIVMLLGCGAKDTSSRPKTVPVSGTVTWKSQPVSDAQVVFAPASGRHGATGMTDASGKFSLTTFQAGDGAVPGEYKVAVLKFDRPAAGAASTNPDGTMSADYVPPGAGPAPAAAPPKSLLPVKYGDPKSSELKATIKESGENRVSLDLQ